MEFLTSLCSIPFWHSHLDDLKFPDKYKFSPRKIVRDHCSRHSHLLTSQNEFTDPDQAHHMVPPHVLQRPRNAELHKTLFILNSTA